MKEKHWSENEIPDMNLNLKLKLNSKLVKKRKTELKFKKNSKNGITLDF